MRFLQFPGQGREPCPRGRCSGGAHRRLRHGYSGARFPLSGGRPPGEALLRRIARRDNCPYHGPVTQLSYGDHVQGLDS